MKQQVSDLLSGVLTNEEGLDYLSSRNGNAQGFVSTEPQGAYFVGKPLYNFVLSPPSALTTKSKFNPSIVSNKQYCMLTPCRSLQ
jgi:hypothetical protein